MVVASFHLSRFSPAQAVVRTTRVPLDRFALRRTPGLRFGRLLGTGAGRTMAASADLRRWAMFAVWEDESALADWTRSPLGQAFAGAVESFAVTLRPLGAQGTWDGVDPVDGQYAGGRPAGPVAVLTRATIRPTRLRAFHRAVPAADAAVAAADGLLETVGIGEYPVGRQATFSLWRDVAAVRDFAYRDDDHLDAIRRVHDEGWYREEWFARFEPLSWAGTWSGARPLG